MNREILFRGKSVDNGEWVEGFYIEDRWGDSNGNEIHGILKDRVHPPFIADWVPIRIKKETVGQYTGLTDKNGKKIFEGDIVAGIFNGECITGNIFFGSDATFHINRKGSFGIWLNNAECWLNVIGNIWDDPELLEEKENA